MLKYVPWNWLICIKPRFLKLILIPDDLKTKEMCNKAVEKVSRLLLYVPVCFRTTKMCKRALAKCLHSLRFIHDYLKTQKMRGNAVEEDPYQPG